MIGLIHIVIGSFHVCYVYRGALRRLMHTEVCIGLDIAHFPSLMYGFIMQQIYYILYMLMATDVKQLRGEWLKGEYLEYKRIGSRADTTH